MSLSVGTSVSGSKSFTRAFKSVDKGKAPSPEKEGFIFYQKKKKNIEIAKMLSGILA